MITDAQVEAALLTFQSSIMNDRLAMRAALEAAERAAPPEQQNPWYAVLDEECVLCHIDPPREEETPKVLLNRIICWHTGVALDPAVSEAAKGLYASGYRDGQVAMRDGCATAAWRAENYIRALPIKEPEA